MVRRSLVRWNEVSLILVASGRENDVRKERDDLQFLRSTAPDQQREEQAGFIEVRFLYCPPPRRLTLRMNEGLIFINSFVPND